jgi:thiol-disulfide isomerase/thioredoxin
MRKVIFYIVILFFITSCDNSGSKSSSKKPNVAEPVQETVPLKETIVIKGTIKNAKGALLTFLPIDDKEFNIQLDDEGTFETGFTKDQEGPIMYSVGNNRGMLWINDGDTASIEMDFNDGNVYGVVYGGNQTNELCNEFNKKQRPFLEQDDRDRENYEKLTDARQRELLYAKMRSNYIRNIQLLSSIIMADTTTSFGFLHAQYFFPQPNEKLMDYDTSKLTVLNHIFKYSEDKIGDLPSYKMFYQDYVKYSEAIYKAYNTIAPEISLPGIDGKTRNLSDLRGKYVLIDFWASWCGPCRKESPTVVKMYNKYKNKGFEVFSVSIDDSRTRDKWLQAIKDDKMNWSNHVIDLPRSASNAYKVNSIPATFLLDPSGKIIGQNLRGLRLELKLKEIFK